MTQEGPAAPAGIITKLSPRPAAETVARLTGMITDKGMKLFAVIDQAAEAAHAGLPPRDTTLVIFGSPAAGTPVMQAAPLAALDLPLKVLIWDDDSQTKDSYTDPAWLAARHQLSNDPRGKPDRHRPAHRRPHRVITHQVTLVHQLAENATHG